MKKLILLILILVSGMMPTWAQSAAADDIAQLQKEMYQLYNKNDETAFVDITNKLKEAAQKAGDERTFYKAWSNQALYFANHQQRNKGQLIAKDMQHYALNHDHKYGIYTGTHVMGTIQSMMGDYQEGIQNFKKAKKAYGHDDSSGAVIAVWRKINDHQYDEAIALCNKLRSPLFRNDLLSLIHKRKGDYRNAYFTQQRYWEMRDSINSRRNNPDTAKQVIDAFSQSVESHRNGAAPNDDLTMLAIRCLVVDTCNPKSREMKILTRI